MGLALLERSWCEALAATSELVWRPVDFTARD